jgi:hypothetical protein
MPNTKFFAFKSDIDKDIFQICVLHVITIPTISNNIIKERKNMYLLHIAVEHNRLNKIKKNGTVAIAHGRCK